MKIISEVGVQLSKGTTEVGVQPNKIQQKWRFRLVKSVMIAALGADSGTQSKDWTNKVKDWKPHFDMCKYI